MGPEGNRVQNKGLGPSCADNGKWITSVAAIVAPHTCTLVRDAWVLITPARPVSSLALFVSFSSTTFAPVVVLLIFPGFLYVIQCPEADLHSAK